jgi:hypothetical protein
VNGADEQEPKRQRLSLKVGSGSHNSSAVNGNGHAVPKQEAGHAEVSAEVEVDPVDENEQGDDGVQADSDEVNKEEVMQQDQRRRTATLSEEIRSALRLVIEQCVEVLPLFIRERD